MQTVCIKQTLIIQGLVARIGQDDKPKHQKK